VASHQDAEGTASRAARGECLVATLDGKIIGTITMVPAGRGRGCTFYERSEVAILQQFAVHSEFQGNGIGGRLLSLAESKALESGASVVALDTAESASELIAMYRRRGYVEAGGVDWRPKVNYRSVILARELK
jgi:GNAT superfamily N-acetyltransferase